jgi:hypothetical protein
LEREKLRSSDANPTQHETRPHPSLSSSSSQHPSPQSLPPQAATATQQPQPQQKQVSSASATTKTVPTSGMEILETIGRLESVAVPKNFLVLMYPEEKTTIPIKSEQYKIAVTDFVITVAKQKFIKLDNFYICDAFAREIRSGRKRVTFLFFLFFILSFIHLFFFLRSLLTLLSYA